MPTPPTKAASPHLTLGSDTTSLVNLVLASLPSPQTRRSYAQGLASLEAFAEGRPLTRMLLLEWRAAMHAKVSAGTVNTRLAAARKLVREALLAGRIGHKEAWDLLELRYLPQRGTRTGNWLTAEQTHQILAVPDRKDLRGLRNYCILAILYGCALRAEELSTLDVKKLQKRAGRWVFSDIRGKGGRVRTVAVPSFAVEAIQAWMKASKITSGLLIRQLTLKPEGLSTQGIWDIVHKAAAKIGVAGFGPHDLRRTCAQLCKANGGDIEEIQFMLGHADIRTTQRYLGSSQHLVHAVNDSLGI